MKKAALTVIGGGCAGIGVLLFLAGLVFRVEPSEVGGTEVMDVFIGALLGGGVWALLHAFWPAHQRTGFAAGVLLCLCAAGTLVTWHRLQIAVRERNNRTAIAAAAAAARTNTPPSRPLEEVH